MGNLRRLESDGSESPDDAFFQPLLRWIPLKDFKGSVVDFRGYITTNATELLDIISNPDHLFCFNMWAFYRCEPGRGYTYPPIG